MDQINVSSLSLTTYKPSNCNGKIPWPDTPSIKQLFSIPDSIMFYIAKNPSSSEVYLKLAKSCKYFFETHSLIVAARICFGIKICSNDESQCLDNYGKCCVKIDIKKISSKIWLTNLLDLCLIYIPTFVRLFIPKIYRCEEAVVYFSQKITLRSFQLLASKFQKFYMSYVKMFDNDGNAGMLEKILESIPNVKEFNYKFDLENPAATISTIKNVIELRNLNYLQEFVLYAIPEVINIDDLGEFIKNRQNTKFWLSFHNRSAEYKNQLDQLVDTIIASGIPDRIILYYGQDNEKLKVLKNRITI